VQVIGAMEAVESIKGADGSALKHSSLSTQRRHEQDEENDHLN
jgi:hypothetical protein